MRRQETERWLAALWRGMDKERFQFDFISMGGQDGSCDGDILAHGGRFISVGAPDHRARFLRQLRRVMVDHGPYDIVHTHAFSLSGLIQLQALRARIPVRLTHAHQDRRKETRNKKTGARLYGWVSRRLVKSCSTAGLAENMEAASSLFGHRWWFDSRWQLMPCGMDLAPYEQPVKAELRTALGLTSQSKIIGHAGSFHIERNHDFLLRVFDQVARRDPAAVLLLIGDGPLRPALEEKVRAGALRNRIIFVNPDAGALAEYLKIMDVFVYPALHESDGKIVVAAQAAGLPCLISTAVPEETDVVKGSVMRAPLEEGLDPWVDNTQLLLSAPRPHAGMALETIKTSDYTITANVTRLANLYEQLYAETLGA